MKPINPITVELDEETCSYLALLSETGDVADVLATLAHHAADGMRRPGAWERGWVEQVPWESEGWQDRLTADPSAHWRRVPK
jgi:hypothetical protein